MIVIRVDPWHCIAIGLGDSIHRDICTGLQSGTRLIDHARLREFPLLQKTVIRSLRVRVQRLHGNSSPCRVLAAHVVVDIGVVRPPHSPSRWSPHKGTAVEVSAGHLDRLAHRGCRVGVAGSGRRFTVEAAADLLPQPVDLFLRRSLIQTDSIDVWLHVA